MSLRKLLREYLADQLAEPGEHKKTELAAAFLDEHADQAQAYLRELAERQVAELIKELCDQPEQDPLPIFAGFPQAIAVAPGVVKATRNCTLDDLGAGLEYRVQNLEHVRQKFEGYRDAMLRFDQLRASETETVGECTDRLRRTRPQAS